jgi:hypothetical protein
MAFGLERIIAYVVDIIIYDANAGRLYRMDYKPDTREKAKVDITTPSPRFAIDFGSLEVGYGAFGPSGLDFRGVPEGQPIPALPADTDDNGRLTYRPMVRAKLYGKVLNGLRVWSIRANCVQEVIDELYSKFKAAPEAQQGKIPIVELTKTVPVTLGRGARQRTLYVPCFGIVGWTDRVPEMGERTVPPPKRLDAVLPPSVPVQPVPGGSGANMEYDNISF